MEQRKGQEKTAGMLSLEACISVMLFMVLMLLMAGLFRMFMAQNLTAHAALETAESLSLDAYAGEKIGDGGTGSVGEFVNGLFDYYNDDRFFTYHNWFDGEESVESAVKKRFTAYISGGDTAKADQFLELLNVEDGLEGIDFSGSRIEDHILYVHIKYKLDYDFHFGSMKSVQVDQKACARLWK